MNRVDRLFGIVTMLQARKYLSGKQLADKFQISLRTLYRDINALEELGIPVSFEQDKGYYIVQGYFLPPVSFTTEEANALLLMETMIRGFADKSIQKHYSSLVTKVKAVMNSKQKAISETLTRNMQFQIPECFNNDYEYLSEIQTAITNRTVLEISYKNNKEEVSKRNLDPIGLIYYAFSWHMIGWCHYRREYRDFKVSRILALKDTRQPYLKTDHMELKEYMKMLPVNF